VETVRRSLSARLVGRRVVGCRARAVRLRSCVDPASWQPLLGTTLVRVERRGKFLLLVFGELSAVLHLGMSGRLLVVAPGAPLQPHTHLTLHFEGAELHFQDPRRFGRAEVWPTARLAEVPALAGLGPDALAEGVEEVLLAAAARTRAPIRSVLLDQRVVAGLGNIYATEALARAGIRPTRPAGGLAARRLRSLAAAIRSVLEEAIAAGGTTLQDGGFQDAEGRAGFFAVELCVYGRVGLPCRRCGSSVRRLALGGRSAYFCPRCQR
jgi:formamidopyrimidine-DNA glycosylase